MNEVMEKEIILEDMIYEVRNVQVMLSSEVFATKFHGYFYNKMVTHYDIGKPISVWRLFL